MDHEQAEDLLQDWVDGGLDRARAADVERHMESCEECRAMAGILGQVKREVGEHGESLWLPHPQADVLAAFAMSSASLSTAEIASIANHVRACPTCSRETELARSADASGWFTRLQAMTAIGSANPSRWLQPALAAVAVLLVAPAYWGLVELPRTREGSAARERQVIALEADRARLESRIEAEEQRARSMSGAVTRPVLLAGSSRGSSESPTVSISAGQTFVTLLLDRDPNGGAVAVWRERPDSLLWERSLAKSTGGSLEALLAVVVPAEVLKPGPHRLILRSPAGTVTFEARFSVRRDDGAGLR